MSDDPAAALDAFREQVLSDAALQARLRDLPDRAAFVAQVVAVGAEQGFDFTPTDVERAMADTRRAFLISQKRIFPWMYAN